MNGSTIRLAIHVLIWGEVFDAFIVHLSTVAGHPPPLFLFAVLVVGWALVDIFLSVFLSSIVNYSNCGAARDRGGGIGSRNYPKCDEAVS